MVTAAPHSIHDHHQRPGSRQLGHHGCTGGHSGHGHVRPHPGPVGVMAKAPVVEEEFENITNPSQLLAAPDLRWEWVPLRGVKTSSGKTARVRAYELSLREYN